MVVIGSGITGTSVAWHLLGDCVKKDSHEVGLEVVMLEAREACWGATGRVSVLSDNGPASTQARAEHVPQQSFIIHFILK